MSALPARVWLIVGLVMLNQPSPTAAATAQKVETISASDIRSGAANFNGRTQEAQEVFDSDGNESKTPPKEPLFQQYGIRTFTAFEKHPELVSSLKKLNPKFNPHQMGTSSLSSIAMFDGRTLLILSGCFPHNCGGTQQIVAFEPLLAWFISSSRQMSAPKPRRQASSISTAIRIVQSVRRCTVLIFLILIRFAPLFESPKQFQRPTPKAFARNVRLPFSDLWPSVL